MSRSRILPRTALHTAFTLALGLLSLLALEGEPASVPSPIVGGFPSPGPRLNDCPVIMVHGFLGYGQDQRLPLSAWGGMGDYRLLLAKEGFKIFSATVGPVSSNWNRACELYAYIKGGRTDYGAAHSARFGHARFGREYPGVHPSWGEGNKVHLLCHSMGGQTARLLVQLLERGDTEELAAAPPDASLLFSGGHHWVLGLITLCSPHDGTTLSLVADFGSQAAKRAICMLLAAASPLYDGRLDQWGLERRPGEGTAAYASRLEANSAWYLGMDSSWYDLRPSGAAEFNGRVGAQSDVYYFSWAASATHESAGRQLPNVSMNPLLALNAVAMGRYRGIDGPWILDQSWEENDGTVNRISMDGPKLGSMDRILPFSGRPLRGIWNYMGCLAETDHVDLLGLATPPWYSPPGFASSEDWYRYNMLLLASLEDGP